MYIPIRNPQGGGQIFFFSGGKTLGSEGNVREIYAKPRIKIRPQNPTEFSSTKIVEWVGFLQITNCSRIIVVMQI
jgi:hypothetical protein